MNERITENIVRKLLQQLGYFANINCIVEEQSSSNSRIKKLLQYASKNGNGAGKPEFILSFKNDTEFLIVIECKADISKHESKTREKYKDYAVDGVLLYSNFLSKDYNVMSIAVSGETEQELKISHFLQLKGAYVSRDITDKQLLDYNSYKTSFKNQSKPLKDEEIVKKAIEYNELLHGYSVPETERNTLISTILISLQDGVFLDSFHKYEKNLDLIKGMLESCSRVLGKNKIEDKRKDTILHEYKGILHNQKLTREIIKNKKKNVPNVILKDLINDLKNNVLPFIKEKDFDILGRFYREFIRYAGSDGKTGLVLTPSHITDLFCKLANLNSDDIVYDPCCGTGGFLVSAMKYMLNKAGNDINEWRKIKQNRLIGVEIRADMFTHACSNMMMRGDGKSNIYNEDCFDNDVIEKIKSYKANKSFLNPPYDVGANGQLEFIENTLECLVKGGKCIAICQMSTVVKQGKKITAVKEKLLEKHTLGAVFSMPDQLFYPKGVITSILIFKAHIPHPVNKEVFFGYFKDDGHVLKKHKGRLDDGSWNSKKEHMLELYINNKSKPGFSITKCVTAQNEWCAEVYMETDYKNLQEKDFIKNLKKYLSYLFNKANNNFSINSDPLLKIMKKLDVDNWRYFSYDTKKDGIFNIKKGKRLTKNDQISGNIPYVSSSSLNNGIDNYIDNEYTEQNCITFACYGSIGEIFYQNEKIWVSDNANVFYLRNKSLNPFIALFLVTILRLEKYRFSYGMTAKKERLQNFKIKLPVDKNNKPDWQFMEDYIKSLPYSKNLGEIT